MKLISWNVNGIRSVLKKGFMESLQQFNADIICLQETRAYREQVELDLPDYQIYWYAAERKGYAGTAILSKIPPIGIRCGLGIPEHDREGRIITAEFSAYYLINVYTPNAQRNLNRLVYRTQQWDSAFLDFLKELERHKPVVFCGDLNVAHQEIDLANPKTNRGNAGFTDEERERFNQIINAGFIDTFREFHQNNGHYTWWSYQKKSRERNVGWRIDYVGISKSLRPYLKDAFILSDVPGSDHCPVGIRLNL